ncbi:MAG: citrate synthase [Bdellovibrionales bacterium RIFCSPHIGHO2_01_FULL_40_29]|nr:MAG: citrate synthase [Bdellovibrionales bacterium RIFCSPHIGHO2_01_FULL_40_29]OFZ34093.1 MAG: citrate synthase [Bdellovibrionales bacterium RIFCSPHIGHO2_02_FULL_40_15]
MAEVTIYEGALDKGLEGVVACTTAVSFIVGNTLNYRGYTIEDLVAHSNFEEVIFLLWNNRLPSAVELEKIKSDLNKNMTLDSEYVSALKTLPTDVHPMTWLRTAVSLMAHWDKDANDNSTEANMRKAIRLVAKMGSIVCAFEAIRNKREILNPVAGKSIAWNFMRMLKGTEPDPELVNVMDTCLILHADHELNCSAFATRVTASSLSDMHSAIVSAIGALKGPLHGGANEQVMVMLAKIGTMDKAQQFVKDALNAKEKVMGIGHRVYKDGDPRAAILRKFSKTLTAKIGKPELYEMSVLIDETMNKEKGLMPNVDFYSATVYHSMGIPTDIFTPIFAVSRVAGWIAHANEQYEKNRIYRPRGKWQGPEGLSWKPVEDR